MTTDERIQRVRELGYSPKEAEFIALAALTSSYFLRRQYSKEHGKPAHVLCRKVIGLGHARTYQFAGKTQVYHLSSKPLYAALGEQDNRHRRARDPFAIRAKLMHLDFVLEHPQFRFFPTEREKLDYFCGQLQLPPAILPVTTFRGKDGTTTDRYCVEKFPVFLDGQTVGLGYIDDGLGVQVSFETFLLRYANLATAVDRTRVVYICCSELAANAGRKVFTKMFAISTQSAELLEYFQLRKAAEAQDLRDKSKAELDRYRVYVRRYREERFEQQYAAWLAGKMEPEASRQNGVEFAAYVLPYSYTVGGIR